MKNIFLLTLTLFVVQFTQAQCSGYIMNITSTDPTCYGFSDGSLTATTTGGNGGDDFTITDTSSTQINITNTANSLLEGWYYVTVVDNMGCILEDSVYIESPEELDVTLGVTNILCGGTATGSIFVDTVYNAAGDYNQISYFWSPNPNGTNGLGQDSIGGLSAGLYNLIINDENGCSNNWEIELNESP